ncbi:MAG: tetraacyldisaccharide 4'-kinase [Candidatus Midichloriaceae bacterium]|jgi:tetraacyldisaccharide 4'-kinase
MKLIYELSNFVQNIFWKEKGVLNYLLTPLSHIYSLIQNSRYYLFQTPYKLNCKIICVGNSISGGSGKTPVVLRLVQLLNNKDVAVVTRGYKGSLSNHKNVHKVNLKQHTFKDVGDEAILLAEYSDVYISKNRRLAVQQAENEGAKLIILDDGLQDNTIYKDLVILIINDLKNENNLTIPAGPMRESLTSSFRKSDMVMLNNLEEKEIVKKYDKNKTFVIKKQVIANQEKIKDKTYILICGIANPDRVLKTIENLNITLRDKFIYPDHYVFSEDELTSIYKTAYKLDLKILTTTKDFVRIPKKFAEKTDIIDYSVEFENEIELKEKIIKLLS